MPSIDDILNGLKARAAFFTGNQGFGPEPSVLVKNPGDEDAVSPDNVFSHSWVSVSDNHGIMFDPDANGGSGGFVSRAYSLDGLHDGPEAYDNGKFLKSTAAGWVWDDPPGGGIDGSGTANKMVKWTDTDTIEAVGNMTIEENVGEVRFDIETANDFVFSTKSTANPSTPFRFHAETGGAGNTADLLIDKTDSSPDYWTIKTVTARLNIGNATGLWFGDRQHIWPVGASAQGNPDPAWTNGALLKCAAVSAFTDTQVQLSWVDIDSIGGGTVDGSGTANTVPKWSDTDTLTDSQLVDNGTKVSFVPNTSGGFEIQDGSYLRLQDGNGGNHWELKGPALMTENVVLALPAAKPVDATGLYALTANNLSSAFTWTKVLDYSGLYAGISLGFGAAAGGNNAYGEITADATTDADVDMRTRTKGDGIHWLMDDSDTVYAKFNKSGTTGVTEFDFLAGSTGNNNSITCVSNLDFIRDGTSGTSFSFKEQSTTFFSIDRVGASNDTLAQITCGDGLASFVSGQDSKFSGANVEISALTGALTLRASTTTAIYEDTYKVAEFTRNGATQNYWRFEGSNTDLKVEAQGTDSSIGIIFEAKSGGDFWFKNNSGDIILRLDNPGSSSVEYLTIASVSNGNDPEIRSTEGIKFEIASDEEFIFQTTSHHELLKLISDNNSNNHFEVHGNSTNPKIEMVGTSTTIGLDLVLKGAGASFDVTGDIIGTGTVRGTEFTTAGFADPGAYASGCTYTPYVVGTSGRSANPAAFVKFYVATTTYYIPLHT